MYSLVLMAALTTGSVTPDCHRCGCYGGGCWGGGCYGGCYGGYGCWGCGGGCFGCFGGCYGGGCYGCWGGYASWGGYGYGAGGMGMGYPGSVYPGGMMAPGAASPGAGGQTGEPIGQPTQDNKNKPKNGTMLDTTKAKLVVELPANAKLFIDDMPMKNTTGVRSFNTPSLEPGQAYYYMVRVETVRDGKTVSESRRVIVRAGQIARADFKELTSDAVRTVRAK